jgi:hypothetical protein
MKKASARPLVGQRLEGVLAWLEQAGAYDAPAKTRERTRGYGYACIASGEQMSIVLRSRARPNGKAFGLWGKDLAQLGASCCV